jgi:hypothetical protein
MEAAGWKLEARAARRFAIEAAAWDGRKRGPYVPLESCRLAIE